MRVALDTNIVISGSLWDGPPQRVLKTGTDRRADFFTSSQLVAELRRVIGYPHLAPRLASLGLTNEKVVDQYRKWAELVVAPPLATQVSRDREDDAVLACAVAARADIIVSSDGDLLSLQEYCGIPILRAVEFLRLVEGTEKQ